MVGPTWARAGPTCRRNPYSPMPENRGRPIRPPAPRAVGVCGNRPGPDCPGGPAAGRIAPPERVSAFRPWRLTWGGGWSDFPSPVALGCRKGGFDPPGLEAYR